MGVDVWTVRVGDLLHERGRDTTLIVHRVDPACSSGRAQRHGPYVHAHVRPGGYGTGFDAETADRFEQVDQP